MNSARRKHGTPLSTSGQWWSTRRGERSRQIFKCWWETFHICEKTLICTSKKLKIPDKFQGTWWKCWRPKTKSRFENSKRKSSTLHTRNHYKITGDCSSETVENTITRGDSRRPIQSAEKKRNYPTKSLICSKSFKSEKNREFSASRSTPQ